MIFNLNNYNQQMTTMGCMIDHNHLDKKYIQHTLPKRTICGSLLIILFDSDSVYIYLNKLIKITQTARGWSISFLKRFSTQT
jgi:hypothetical protein